MIISASPGCGVSSFSVIDPDINFSDHLPLLAVIECAIPFENANNSVKPSNTQKQLRWDKADLVSFYQFTGAYLNPLLTKLDNAIARYSNNCTISDNITDIIENMYYEIVSVLTSCAESFVPKRKKIIL